MILKTLMREHLDVYSATETYRIIEVAEIMREKRVGSIVIVDDSNWILGIITDRDIAMALALGAATADSFVSEVMSTEVQTIPESMNLFDVADQFRTLGCKRLPVVDSNQELVGIVSNDDVMAFLARAMIDTCGSMESKLGHII